MLVAFAQTFYFKPFFPETDAITILVAIHGTVMTGWAVLFAAQSALIIARRPNLHRRLGIFGLGWAAAVVVMGTVMTVHAAARDVRSHDEHAAITIQILALELAQMALFAGFVTFGYMLRQRPGFHRRLMTFTLACMLPSLIARLPIGAHSTLAILLWTDAVVLAIITLDVLKNRSLHPGLMAGAAPTSSRCTQHSWPEPPTGGSALRPRFCPSAGRFTISAATMRAIMPALCNSAEALHLRCRS